MDNNLRIPLVSRFKNAWNTFRDRDPSVEYQVVGGGYSTPYHRTTISSTTETSMVSAIFNRCAIDVAQLTMKHVKLDENGHYLEDYDSGLNRCLTLSANIDQGARAFMRDAVISMFDEGVVAIVPVDTTLNMDKNPTFDILSLRVGRVVKFYAQHVLLEVYNDQLAMKQHITMHKSKVAIVENPLYTVMNEPNSTLKRLMRKLNLLDAIDEQSGSGKLDLIIQLPYAIKSEAKKKIADERMQSLTDQLQNSKYGVAYADATEKVIQLNRPAENNLMGQIEYLTSMLYGQLGLSDAIFNGSATPDEWLNYYNRTVEPVASAITEELKRKFLTPTAITQGQSIEHFRNPFSLVTPETLAELADKLTRNEILSSNEVRSVIGFRPSKDPGANELRNKNLNVPEEKPLKENNQNGSES